jgi:hypothetical protein
VLHQPDKRVVTREVTVTTVRPGDVFTVGGTPLRIRDITALPARCKLLHFETGETMTIHPGTRVSAVRTVPASAYPQRPPR